MSTFMRVEESRGINSFMLLTVGPDGISMTLIQLEGETKRGEGRKRDRGIVLETKNRRVINSKFIRYRLFSLLPMKV